MLSKETEKKLKAIGIDPKKLATAIKDENEVEFEVPEITSYTEDELSARDENNKKSGEKSGKDKGIDIAIKAIAKKLGVDGEFKDPDSLTEAISKLGKGDSSEQVRLLQQKLETAERERDAEKSNTASLRRDTELLAAFPQNRNTNLSDSEYLSIFKHNYEIGEDDGKVVVKKGGQILRDDKTQSPISMKDALSGMFNERGFIKTEQASPNGRGGSDQQNGRGSGLLTYSAVEAQFKKDHPSGDLMTGEFQSYLAENAKQTGFNMNA